MRLSEATLECSVQEIRHDSGTIPILTSNSSRSPLQSFYIPFIFISLPQSIALYIGFQKVRAGNTKSIIPQLLMRYKYQVGDVERGRAVNLISLTGVGRENEGAEVVFGREDSAIVWQQTFGAYCINTISH